MKIEFLFIGVAILWGCAVVEAPKGGPVDKEAPRLLAMSPANQSTSLSTQSVFQLQFSEWMVNPLPQGSVQISPPVESALQVEVDGDRIWVRPSAPLDSLTTYTISLTNTVADLHSNGLASPLQIVFSTGPHLDSLKVEGIVLLPDSLLRKKKYPIVGLYPLEKESRQRRRYLKKWLDSARVPLDIPDMSREPTLFLSQTDSLGQFRIRGVAPGKYRIAVFHDANKNNIIDITNEIAGVGEGDITVDSVGLSLQYLSMDSQDTTKSQMLEIEAQSKQQMKVLWNVPIPRHPILACSAFTKDSLQHFIPSGVWWDDSRKQMFARFDSLIVDGEYRIHCGSSIPLNVRWKPKQDSLIQSFQSFMVVGNSEIVDSIFPVELTFAQPILVDTLQSRLFWLQGNDTTTVNAENIDPVHIRAIPQKGLRLGQDATLYLKPSAMDTAISPKVLGKVTLINPLKLHSFQGRVTNAKPVHMARLRGAKQISWRTYCQPDGRFQFPRLPEGKYAFDIYVDINRDSLPDAGKVIPYRASGAWRVLGDSLEIGKEMTQSHFDSLFSKISLP